MGLKGFNDKVLSAVLLQRKFIYRVAPIKGNTQGKSQGVPISGAAASFFFLGGGGGGGGG